MWVSQCDLDVNPIYIFGIYYQHGLMLSCSFFSVRRTLARDTYPGESWILSILESGDRDDYNFGKIWRAHKRLISINTADKKMLFSGSVTLVQYETKSASHRLQLHSSSSNTNNFSSGLMGSGGLSGSRWELRTNNFPLGSITNLRS